MTDTRFLTLFFPASKYITYKLKINLRFIITVEVSMQVAVQVKTCLQNTLSTPFPTPTKCRWTLRRWANGYSDISVATRGKTTKQSHCSHCANANTCLPLMKEPCTSGRRFCGRHSAHTPACMAAIVVINWCRVGKTGFDHTMQKWSTTHAKELSDFSPFYCNLPSYLKTWGSGNLPEQWGRLQWKERTCTLLCMQKCMPLGQRQIMIQLSIIQRYCASTYKTTLHIATYNYFCWNEHIIAASHSPSHTEWIALWFS